ncbi:GMC family oxidoreductase [Streptomyces achromogenes]|uniref:GMC family oxidoreductase n=1 Tax=Streptomyces achromogenes TaxID=67255 RepID=UPI003432EAD1
MMSYDGTDQVIFPAGAATQTSAAEAAQGVWDTVIVGGGMAGSIVAEQLGQAGYKVLILEAGPGKDMDLAEYESYLSRFYGAVVKDNQSPYPFNPNARMPRSTDTMPVDPSTPRDDFYLVQEGEYCTDTTFTRVLGGTSMHWEGKALRMLPEDFDLRTKYGQGLNWPLGYDDLEPYYRKAEAELGVAAEVEDQAYLGMHFPKGYVFPMHRMPLSYLDQTVARGVDGMRVNLADDEYKLQVRSFPQARNGVPNAAYDGGKGFVPVGAVSTSQAEEGERCQGNTNCVPLCPVQAKYHSGKTLAKALSKGNVKIVTQAVASKIEIDEHNQRVTGITVKKYESLDSEKYTEYTVEGAVYILCAHAIENARLMLASGMQDMSRSKLIGRNLMDHAYLLTWGLLPEPAGTMRGTTCTGGITDLRGGRFRATQAGFGVDIHNDGWGWATGSPYTDLVELVDKRGLRGRDLRRTLGNQISRQLLLAFMIDLLPDRSNTVTVDERYKDALGNLKPVVSLKIPPYTMRGAAFARKLATDIFEKLGAEDRTTYDKDSYSAVEHDGQWYNIVGGNHLAGTHIMGTDPAHSVVDHTQHSWDHENLYLVGPGSLPSIGTSNISLTMAALAFRSAAHIVKYLRAAKAPAVVRA